MKDEIFGMDAEGTLDQTPLKFGKYKGKTPDKVSELDPQYLIWAYETVAQFPVCSAALYRSVGGKGKRAVHDKLDASSRNAEKVAQEKKASPALGFDTDDDVPF